jgi:hypothetical protein
MSMHPTITAALAEPRRRDLTARADRYRIARAARAARAASPAPARPVQVILHLIVAVRRPVTRLFRLKTPAPAGAGSQS